MAHRDVEEIWPEQVAGHRVGLEREHDVEETTGLRVVQAGRIGKERTECPGRRVEPWRQPIERVLLDGRDQRVPASSKGWIVMLIDSSTNPFPTQRP